MGVQVPSPAPLFIKSYHFFIEYNGYKCILGTRFGLKVEPITPTILIFDDEVFGDFITGTALTGPFAEEYGESEMILVLEVLSGSREG